jgi:hypothetical protein
MAVRVVAMLVMLVMMPGCVIPSGLTPDERPVRAAERPATPSKFGELVSAPGTVVPLHGQELPKNDPAPQTFWPGESKPAQPTETLTPSTLPPVKPTEPFRVASLPGESPVMAAVRAYFDGRTDAAAERISALDPSSRQTLLAMLPALAQLQRSELSKSPQDAALVVRQLEDAADAAGKAAPLAFRKACLVWQVRQFGDYEPVPDKHPFLPGSTAVVYLELANAPCVPAAVPAGGTGYVTRLACSWQLLSADRKPIAARVSLPQYASFSRSPIRDYFLKMEFDVPNTPGQYLLEIELRDPATNRLARQSVEVIVSR